jgi:hypothetical protein
LLRADVPDEREKVIQQHYPTIQLKENATLKDVLWELKLLYASSEKSIH